MKEKVKPVLDINNIDHSIKPGQDFYQYAVGNWLKNNPIPAEYSSWGSFNVLAEENLNVLKEIMEKAKERGLGERGTGDRIEKMVGDFYATGMDEKKIEADGIQPLEEELKRIGRIKDVKGLVGNIAHMHQLTAAPLFNFFVSPDAKNSELNMVELYQGGLNLPDRDYYLKDDQYSRNIREKYKIFAARIFKLMGEKEADAEKDAGTVLKMEIELAKISRDKVELRDPIKNYNPMSLSALSKLSDKFDWPLYFASMGARAPGKINVGQPAFFKGLNKLLVQYPINDWKVYLRFCLVNDNAELLNSAFVNEEFDFYGKTMNGAKVLMPRWKRVIGTVNGSVDQAVGQLFVKEKFSPKAKTRAIEMVKNIRAALRERIKKLDWMDKKTQKAALNKLTAMTFKIGYPDKWKNYSKLEIKRDSYVLNVMRASYFEFQRDIKKIGKKVDKTEWYMPPQIVNAGYMPQQNDMLFPAGILQPPFFNADADDPVNYGAIGTVIAHEMTHGFDDQGSQFDAKGNLKNWWTKR
ncbi:MAG: M13 family metallopeptidase, partial [Candidatus Margulisiibacteriota bacterium]